MSKKLCKKSEKAKAAYKRKRADKLKKQRSILFRKFETKPELVIEFDLTKNHWHEPDVEAILDMYKQQRVADQEIIRRSFKI